SDVCSSDYLQVDAVEDRAAAALQAQAGQADDGGGGAHPSIVAGTGRVAADATGLRQDGVNVARERLPALPLQRARRAGRAVGGGTAQARAGPAAAGAG